MSGLEPNESLYPLRSTTSSHQGMVNVRASVFIWGLERVTPSVKNKGCDLVRCAVLVMVPGILPATVSKQTLLQISQTQMTLSCFD